MNSLVGVASTRLVTESSTEEVLHIVHNDYYVLEHTQHLLRETGVGRALWKHLS